MLFAPFMCPSPDRHHTARGPRSWRRGCFSIGLISGLWLMFLAPPGESASPLPAPDHYKVVFAPRAPRIDGRLDDPIWHQAARTRNFVIHDSGAPAPVRTYAQLAYDHQYLYLAFYAQDKDIYAQFTAPQSPLFQRDDLVEMFIDPLGQGKNYLEIGVSAGAVYYSLRITHAHDGKAQAEPYPLDHLLAATHIAGTLNQVSDRDTGWSTEVRIPLSDIVRAQYSLPTPDKTLHITPHQWRIGLFRIDYDHHTPAWKGLGFYAWQVHGKFGFHRPERFAYLDFLPKTQLAKHR